MKNLILLLVLLITCSLSAQKKMVLIKDYQATEIKKVNAFVDEVNTFAILSPTNDSRNNYLVKKGEFKQGKEYVFWLRVQNCGDCTVKKAEVLGFAITTGQAQRDQIEASTKVKNLINSK